MYNKKIHIFYMYIRIIYNFISVSYPNISNFKGKIFNIHWNRDLNFFFLFHLRILLIMYVEKPKK